MGLIFLEGIWSSMYTELRSWGASKNGGGRKFNFLRGGRGFLGAGGHTMVGFRRVAAAVGVWQSSCSWILWSAFSLGSWSDSDLNGVSGRNSSKTSIPIMQQLRRWPVIQVLMAKAAEREGEREGRGVGQLKWWWWERDIWEKERERVWREEKRERGWGRLFGGGERGVFFFGWTNEVGLEEKVWPFVSVRARVIMS